MIFLYNIVLKKYKIIREDVFVYKYSGYYKNIETGVKYKNSFDVDVHDLYINEEKLISFCDVIRILDQLDNIPLEDSYIPKHISKRKVLKLMKNDEII